MGNTTFSQNPSWISRIRSKSRELQTWRTDKLHIWFHNPSTERLLIPLKRARTEEFDANTKKKINARYFWTRFWREPITDLIFLNINSVLHVIDTATIQFHCRTKHPIRPTAHRCAVPVEGNVTQPNDARHRWRTKTGVRSRRDHRPRGRSRRSATDGEEPRIRTAGSHHQCLGWVGPSRVPRPERGVVEK